MELTKNPTTWWINVGFPIGAILSTGTSAGHSFRTYISQTNSWHVIRGGSYAADLSNITDTSFDFGTYTAGGTYYVTVYEK